MDESLEIKLSAGKPCRGKYPVTLSVGDNVVLADTVNPHDAKNVTKFIKSAIKQLPALEDRSEDLRQEVLNLAKQREKPIHQNGGSHPYVEENGGLHLSRHVGDNQVQEPLTNFTARIVSDVVRDDGVDKETALEIEAALHGRKHRFTVTTAHFSAMNWPIEQMGAGAIVMAGQGTKDHVRTAIQLLSDSTIPRRTIYTHTGWRKLDGGNGGNGGFAYLHSAGCIGLNQEVSVDLPATMVGFRLPQPPTGVELVSAIRASLELLNLAQDSLIFPLFCGIYRAPLGQCDFAIHLAGPSGVFKSEIAALAQQHFGAELDARHLPGSWMSTDNALEGQLSAAKDAITVVDDFAPSGSQHDQARWHVRADRIIRAQGNHSGRARMRADTSMRSPRPPRGLILSTGEEIPRGQSLRARMSITEISKGDIDADLLTACQADAREGRYAAAMAGYLAYIAPNYEKVRDGIRQETEFLRGQASNGKTHCRTPAIAASLAVGLRHFIAFAEGAGALTHAEGVALWNRGWAALLSAANDQDSHQTANEPAARFIELLTSAIASGHAHLADVDGDKPEQAEAWGWRCQTIGSGAAEHEEWKPMGDRIGWVEDGDVLLDPDASYKAAQTMAGGSGDGLVISARTLRRRLDEKGWVLRPGERKELLIRRTLEGRQRNVMGLVEGVLSAQSTKSTKSTTKTGFDAATPENAGSEMVDGENDKNINPPNPPFEPPLPDFDSVDADERAAMAEAGM